jgi:hypothetical protein
MTSLPDDKIIERCRLVQKVETSHLNIGGFLYGNRHVIRDYRKPLQEQEIWSMEQKTPDDYDRCHAAMVKEIEMIGMRAAIKEFIKCLGTE